MSERGGRVKARRWGFRDAQFQIAPGRLPKDPVQRASLRMARAGGRARRMGDELFFLLFGRRLSTAMTGDLERALPRMTTEDIVNARAKLHALVRELDCDQALIERLLETLAAAEGRRLIVLDGGLA